MSEYKTYFYPNQTGFQCSTFTGSAEKAEALGLFEATQEQIDGLKAHTLCWGENNTLVAYVKTAEDIAVEQKQARRAEIRTRVGALKTSLREWDYKTSKYADGDYTDEEWAEIKAQRKAWRNEINTLEAELQQL